MFLTTSLFFIIWSPTIHVVHMLASAAAIWQRDPNEFWISVNLLNVEWKLACLTSTYCNQPEVKMIKTNSVNGEKSSFSWQLDQNFEQVGRTFLESRIVSAVHNIAALNELNYIPKKINLGIQ